jgi:hypothetical protein
MSFAVGQSLVFAPYGKRHEVLDLTVTKIGRKWVTLSNDYRFDPATLRVDGQGYTSPGRMYLSRDEYNTAVAITEAWRLMQNAIDYVPPPGVTVADIEAARKLLRI